MSPMGRMEEEIVAWEEGVGYTAEVIGGRMLPPYEFIRGTISLTSSVEGTLAEFQLEYRLRYGWIGRLLDRLIVKSQFQKGAELYVQGLKEYVESDRLP